MQRNSVTPQLFDSLGTILVVTGDEFTRNALKFTLQAKYEVFLAEDELSCLMVYRACKPHLVLADVSMLETIVLNDSTLLKALTHSQETQVIALASPKQYKSVEWSLTQGVTDYLLKPVNQSLLLHQVHRILWQSYHQTQLEQMNTDLERHIQQQDAEIQRMGERVRSLLNYFVKFEHMKLNIIRNLNHNIRNHLCVISMSKDLLNRTVLPGSEESEYLERIHHGTSEIAQILDCLSLFDQELSGTLKVDPSPVNLPDLCSRLTSEKQAHFSKSHQLTFTNHCPSLPSILLDIGLWQQIFTELLTNAIRFSPRGGKVEITLSQQSEFVIIQIQDEGIGIPVQEIPKVFDQFYRASNADSIPGTPGIGLGLTVVQRAISLHNGTIVINSKIARGTTVTVSIPLISATQQPTFDLANK